MNTNVIFWEETKELFNRLYNGDEAAKDILIKVNDGLVKKNANELQGRIDFKDYCDVGIVGLIKAINTFDLSKGNRFSTYAYTCIKNEMLMYYNKNKREENHISLDDEREENISLKDTLESKHNIEADYIKKEENMKLYNALSKLNDKEKYIIMSYYGILYDEKNDRVISKEFNVSRARVNKLRIRALEKLKEDLKEDNIKRR